MISDNDIKPKITRWIPFVEKNKKINNLFELLLYFSYSVKPVSHENECPLYRKGKTLMFLTFDIYFDTYTHIHMYIYVCVYDSLFSSIEYPLCKVVVFGFDPTL